MQRKLNQRKLNQQKQATSPTKASHAQPTNITSINQPNQASSAGINQRISSAAYSSPHLQQRKLNARQKAGPTAPDRLGSNSSLVSVESSATDTSVDRTDTAATEQSGLLGASDRTMLRLVCITLPNELALAKAAYRLKSKASGLTDGAVSTDCTAPMTGTSSLAAMIPLLHRCVVYIVQCM
jgi:hypothetical protein